MAPKDAEASTEPDPRDAVTEYSPLQSEIKKLIKSSGPMPVWRYMELCLTHPNYGYYISRDPLGREGDFTTSPEVSQMFGELLGLWVASVWKAMGSPSLLRLIELGPGRGTMMVDALRALRVLPPLYQALSIHLVEINPVLREKQKAALSGVRIIGEFFREPDPQLGFLWGGLTMGMLLSVPMIIAGVIIIVVAWRRKPLE